MQVLIQGKPVQEDATKDNLLEIMADKYSRTILESTIEMPKSVLDLSKECGVPISTAYRRVQRLHGLKLLSVSGSINKDGKKYFLYKSKIKSIMTCLNNGMLDVEIIPNFT